jgi:hypothetical protein
MAYVPPYKRATTEAGGSSTPFAAAAMRRFAALEEPAAPSRFDALGPSKPRPISPENRAPFQEPVPSPPVEMYEESIAAGAVGTAVAAGSMSDWLKQAQKGYVHKTPEEIRQECLSMNYSQLKARAGPPPPIGSDDYGGVWEQGGEGEGGRTCMLFDDNIRFFKLGRCPPPEPLFFNGRDEPVVDAALARDGVEKVISHSETTKRRIAYSSWYEQWGKRLTYLWNLDHPKHTPTHKKPDQKQEEEKPKAPPRRILEEACAKSGW